MNKNIYSILSKLSISDLNHLIDYEKLVQVQKILSHNRILKDDKNSIIKIVYSYYGYDLFSDIKVRRALFFTLSPQELKLLSSKYGNQNFDKAYDNAIELSLIPWKSDSDFVNKVAELFDIPIEFLPQSSFQIPTSVEIKAFSQFYPLHEYQAEIKNKIIYNLINGKKRFLIQMPTGSGKTRTTLHSLVEYAQKISLFRSTKKLILWVAHTEELNEQALETLISIWPHLSDDSIMASRLWGSHKPVMENLISGFVFSTFQKLTSLKASDNWLYKHLKKSTNIIVVDEAHKTTAETYSLVIEDIIANENNLIGLTATPGRTYQDDEENKKLAKYYNQNLVSIESNENPIKYLQNIGILSKLNLHVIETNIEVRGGNENRTLHFDLPLTTIKSLASNNIRNEIIINIIEREVKIGNPCLVFSCSTEHSQILNAVLSLKGISSVYVDANTNPYRRKKNIDYFKLGNCDVLINYGILTTGFDAPRVRTIIITRPTTSIVLYSQILGRGLRGPKMGGAKSCNLYDIRDNYINFGGIDDVYNYFDDYWNVH